MDRAYLLQAKLPSIQEMGIAMFRKAVFDDKQLQPKIVEGFCDLIGSDRAGELASQSLSKDAVTLFHDLAVYINIIEPRLLRLAQDYIIDWTGKAVKEMTLADYALSSVQLMESELNRCKVLGLDLSTRRDLETLLEHQIVQRQQDTLCELCEITLAASCTNITSKCRQYRRSSGPKCGN